METVLDIQLAKYDICAKLERLMMQNPTCDWLKVASVMNPIEDIAKSSNQVSQDSTLPSQDLPDGRH